MNRRTGYLCLASAAMGIAGMAMALTGDGNPATETSIGGNETQDARRHAARAYVHPETGALGAPTVSQQGQRPKASREAQSRGDAGLVIRKRADGTETVHLMGRYQNVSMITMTPEGPRQGCVNHAAHTAAAQ